MKLTTLFNLKTIAIWTKKQFLNMTIIIVYCIRFMKPIYIYIYMTIMKVSFKTVMVQLFET
jgi:hypothetical protein